MRVTTTMPMTTMPRMQPGMLQKLMQMQPETPPGLMRTQHGTLQKLLA